MFCFDEKLALFSVGCDVDRELSECYSPSKYEVNIQAGRELSNIEKYEYVDNIGKDNISVRNRRYSEFTALYWIRRNVKADYIGICHYRRKFMIDDDTLDVLLNDGIDIISTPVECFERSISDEYCLRHYKSDWNAFMSILEKNSPDYYETAVRLFSENKMHIASMGIYRYELFVDMCDWMFPILDEFYHSVNEKFDIFQNRDVGFIGERMVSLYCEHNKNKYKCKEIPWRMLDVVQQNMEQTPENAFDVEKIIVEKIKNHQLSQAIVILKNTSVNSNFIDRVKVLFNIYAEERKKFGKTLFEYLHNSDNIEEMVSDLDSVAILLNNYISDGKHKQSDILSYIYSRGFSYIYLISVLQAFGLYNQESEIVIKDLLEKVIKGLN